MVLFLLILQSDGIFFSAGFHFYCIMGECFSAGFLFRNEKRYPKDADTFKIIRKTPMCIGIKGTVNRFFSSSPFFSICIKIQQEILIIGNLMLS